jgi:AmmeMemoRadiSam system protein B
MRVKRSTLAGSWYPKHAATLRATVDELLERAPGATGDRWVGALVPHAGYQYSGAVAAHAYRQLSRVPATRVVILAPSHRGAYRGIAVPDLDAFETPLGQVRVHPATGELVESSFVRLDDAPFHGEHSLEIQLPFVQRVLPDASVVPLLAGSLFDEDYDSVAALLERMADASTVFVISSDLTHYGWRFDYVPFRPASPEEARRMLRDLDMGAIDPVLRCDPDGFEQYLERTGDTVCGRVPVRAFLTWARASLGGTLLDYRTSLDVTGDYEHCVSYAAIAFGPSPKA